jgi:hypothetical protein
VRVEREKKGVENKIVGTRIEECCVNCGAGTIAVGEDGRYSTLGFTHVMESRVAAAVLVTRFVLASIFMVFLIVKFDGAFVGLVTVLAVVGVRP